MFKVTVTGKNDSVELQEFAFPGRAAYTSVFYFTEKRWRAGQLVEVRWQVAVPARMKEFVEKKLAHGSFFRLIEGDDVYLLNPEEVKQYGYHAVIFLVALLDI